MFQKTFLSYPHINKNLFVLKLSQRLMKVFGRIFFINLK